MTAMLSASSLAVFLVLVSSGTPLAAHESDSRVTAREAALSTDEREVVELLDTYARAITANDLSRVKPLLVSGDGFSYFEGAFVNNGWQEFHDHMAPEMALFERPSYRMTDIRPFARGDLGYATFAWAMDVTVVSDKVAGGRHPVAMSGKGTAVVSREDGHWKIRHLQTAMAPAKKAKASEH